MITQSNFKFLLVITLILSFAFGVSVGYFAPHRQHFGRHGGPGGPGGMKKMMLHKLEHKLNLTADQKQKVQQIFEANEPKMRAMHEQMKPQFDAIRDQTRDEIRKVLTPEQITKFEVLNAKMDERREKRVDSKRERG